jgi:hypothetical protein
MPQHREDYALAQAGFARRSQSAGGFGNPPRVPIKITNHFVSLCSVCLRHLLQNFDSLSFSAFARLFFVLE